MVKYDSVGNGVLIECRIDISVYCFFSHCSSGGKKGLRIHSLPMVSGERFPVIIVLPLCLILTLFASKCAS
jgi:hypothetical protein